MDLEAELTITNKLYIGEAFDRFMQTLLEVEYLKT